MAAFKAIVTGHSRGFGEGIAAALLERDIPVLGVSRSANKTLTTKHGRRLEEEQLDLTDADATTAWLQRGALQQFVHGARTALLVNNAGLLQPIGPLQDQAAMDVWRTISVNIGAALSLSAAFVQATERCDERRILHISSGAGRKAYAGWSVYCATKAALDHHARAVALDHTPKLRVCSLAPGIIETAMQAEIRGSTDALFPDRERFVKLKREGQLKSPDVAANELVDFLLSKGFGKEP